VRLRLFSIPALLLVASSAGYSASISFSGTFTHDDDIQLFLYSVQNTGQVDVFTTSFAVGGFAPILTVFDNAGNYLFENDGAATNDCVNNAMDIATGACWDARLSWNSLAGLQYIVALTEDDNRSRGTGFTLSDPFTEQGNGDFTGEPPFGPATGGAFLLSSGAQRTNEWAVTFQSADPTLTASAIPEPSTVVLLLTGAGLIAIGRRRTRKTNR
jgi:hypothetical protein